MRKFLIATKLVFLFLVVLIAQAVSAIADPIFYTVDITNDHLVSLDANTGVLTDIGALGFDVKDIDLTTLNGKLYGLHSDYLNRVDLHEINPFTGASISSVQVKNGGVNILSAEGLTAIGGQLKIGFSTNNDKKSNGLGDLALDGTMSNTNSYQTDFDGLCTDDSSATIYGNDVINSSLPGQHTDFFTVGAPPNINVFYTLDPNITDGRIANDLKIVEDNLFAIDHSNDQLHKIDLLTSTVSSIDIMDGIADLTYFGLASALEPTPVPEPTTVVLLGICLAGLAGVELRRRKRKKAVEKV